MEELPEVDTLVYLKVSTGWGRPDLGKHQPGLKNFKGYGPYKVYKTVELEQGSDYIPTFNGESKILRLHYQRADGTYLWDGGAWFPLSLISLQHPNNFKMPDVRPTKTARRMKRL